MHNTELKYSDTSMSNIKKIQIEEQNSLKGLKPTIAKSSLWSEPKIYPQDFPNNGVVK